MSEKKKRIRPRTYASRLWGRNHYAKNREKFLEEAKKKYKKYYYANIEKQRERKRKYWYNPVRRKKHQEYALALLNNWKNKVFSLFDNKCKKCGFADRRAFQIDHIYGNGREDNIRRKGYTYYRRVFYSILADENQYQLLCANCNWIKKVENNENKGVRNVKKCDKIFQPPKEATLFSLQTISSNVGGL